MSWPFYSRTRGACAKAIGAGSVALCARHLSQCGYSLLATQRQAATEDWSSGEISTFSRFDDTRNWWWKLGACKRLPQICTCSDLCRLFVTISPWPTGEVSSGARWTYLGLKGFQICYTCYSCYANSYGKRCSIWLKQNAWFSCHSCLHARFMGLLNLCTKDVMSWRPARMVIRCVLVIFKFVFYLEACGSWAILQGFEALAPFRVHDSQLGIRSYGFSTCLSKLWPILEQFDIILRGMGLCPVSMSPHNCSVRCVSPSISHHFSSRCRRWRWRGTMVKR